MVPVFHICRYGRVSYGTELVGVTILATMLQPDRIEIRAGREMHLTWSDGSTDAIPAHVLRDACPCATCRNLDTPRLAHPDSARIASAALVGSYAISVVFAPDGHATGIYPFDELRSIAQH
jgi:DUF971 family protein